MNKEDILIISGGALGSDSVWGLLAEQSGIPKNNIFHILGLGMKRPTGSADRKAEQESGTTITCTEQDYTEAKEAFINLGLTISGKQASLFFKEDGVAQKLHARNYWQVVNGDQVLAVVALVGNDVSGGTATAVHLAIKLGKPVYVLNTCDAKWYHYQNGKYIKCDTPKLVERNTCIGTRTLVQYNICKHGNWVPAPYVGAETEQALRAQMAKVFA